jgi:hypothetical protein
VEQDASSAINHLHFNTVSNAILPVPHVRNATPPQSTSVMANVLTALPPVWNVLPAPIVCLVLILPFWLMEPFLGLINAKTVQNSWPIAAHVFNRTFVSAAKPQAVLFSSLILRVLF